MNNNSITQLNSCKLCNRTVLKLGEVSRCTNCLEKGDLVGKIVWDIVSETVQNSEHGRIIYMLTDLSPIFLEGIVRNTPSFPELSDPKSPLIAINPDIAENLEIHPPAISSTEKPIYWRHSDEARLVLFAPTNDDREEVIAGLAPVARMDSQTIMDYKIGWLNYLDENDP